MFTVAQVPKRAQYLLEFSSPILERFFTKAGPGRKGYGVALFQGLLVRQRLGWTYLELEEQTGIDETTFIKAEQRFTRQKLFVKIFRHLVQQLLKTGRIPAVTLAADGSFVETYSKHAEAGSAWSGHKEKHGYKLHAVVDTETELPLALLFSSGERHDSQFLIPLVKSLKDLKIHPTYVLADKGYDSEELVWAINRLLGAAACIPRRKSRAKGKPSLAAQAIMDQGRITNPELYKKRTAVERFFSYSKGKFHLGTERTRGFMRFVTNCFKVALCWLLEKLVKRWEICML